MSFRWTSDPNRSGYEGQAYATGGSPGQGQHGSMSRHELRNVGLARGPSFNNGTSVESPTGNIDLAPTILHLLGIEHGHQDMDGRVIWEAMAGNPSPSTAAWISSHEAEAEDYRQRVQISHVGASRYIDWGNRV